jgi:acyl-[acyl-carrier-protein] desaturase
MLPPLASGRTAITDTQRQTGGGTAALLEELERPAADLLERHLARSKEWFPHEMVPWPRAGGATDAGPPAALAPGVESALWINLLTEDNLPYYFHAIASTFTWDSAMGEWSRRWTAEEQRHSIVIRDWICFARQLDLVALERARMQQVCGGFVAGARGLSVADGLVYLTLQELATRVSHWNTGRLLDSTGCAVMRRVAADENLHFLFYRDLTTAAIAVDASELVMAIDRQVTGFEMPGSGIEGFARHAAAVSRAGIYDFRIHYEQILLPVVVAQWNLPGLTGLSPEAERAREQTMDRIARIGRVAGRLADGEPSASRLADGEPSACETTSTS